MLTAAACSADDLPPADVRKIYAEGKNMELIGSKTYKNLAKAFAGECMAQNRYKYIEYGARQKGYKNIASVIDEIVYQEFNHARMFYSFIQAASNDTICNIDITSGYPFRQKWELADNLAFAAEDEHDEAERIYPEYADIAEDEGFSDIAGLFGNVAAVELRHNELFTRLHELLAGGRLYKADEPTVWRCADCGYEAEGKSAFKVCPLCQAKQGSVVIPGIKTI